MTSTTSTTATAGDVIPEQVMQSIRDSLRGLRYGQVTVIVQDGRVIQIDRMERHRFGAKDELPASDSGYVPGRRKR